MEVVGAPVQVSFSTLVRRYTLEEFWALPEPEDRSQYELIGGYLFMVPPPDPPHGSIDARLNKSLIKFLLTHEIDGEVHHPREPIYRGAEGATYLEPDMMYVSSELRSRMGDKRTSADIVFEYISKSNAMYDHTTKADTYLALGVRELWLVDPDAVTIEVRYPTVRANEPAWESSRYPTGAQPSPRVLDISQLSVHVSFPR